LGKKKQMQATERNGIVNNQIFKQIELTGTSETSMEDAVQRAITKAAKTIHNMQWFEVIETRGAIENDQTIQWQVLIKVGFSLDD